MHLAITGPTLDRSLLIAVTLAGAVLAFFFIRRAPKVCVAIWIVTLSFVPIWLGANIGFNGNYFLPAISAVSLLIICALIPAPLVHFSFIDALVVLLIVVSFSALFTASPGIALTFLITFLTYFLVGYAVGRLAPLRVDVRWIYGCIAVVFTAVAIMAIIEFFASWNPFILLRVNNTLYETWGTLQARGGVLRAEGAFGHSIALGCSLAMAVPLTLASRFGLWIRVAMITLMLIATVVTFSRIGMITALLGLILAIVFLKGVLTTRTRVVVSALMIVVSAVLFPLITTVFTDAGTEATGSADYRGNLLSLVGTMNVVGVADSARKDTSGQVYFGNFISIDSQLILTGLTSGLLALIVIVIALAGGIVLVLRGKATAATIAVVAQIPALATVALITQYSIFFWFLVGVAATTQLAAKFSSDDSATVDHHSPPLHVPILQKAQFDPRH